MARILIAGAGVGGLAAAHRLRRQLPDSDEIIVFDQSPVHTFWPSLLWLMTGTRQADQLQRPLDALKEQHITVVNAPITALDPKGKTVSRAPPAGRATPSSSRSGLRSTRLRSRDWPPNRAISTR